VEGFETAMEINRPLAGDVVGNFDVVYLTMLEVCRNNIVGVYITRTTSALSHTRYDGFHTVLHVVGPQQRLEV